MTSRHMALAGLIGCASPQDEGSLSKCIYGSEPVAVDEPGSGGFTATEAAAEWVARAPRWTVQWSDASGTPVVPPIEYSYSIDSVSDAVSGDISTRETGEAGCWLGSAEGWLYLESYISFDASGTIQSLDGEWVSKGPDVLNAYSVRGPVASTESTATLPEAHIEFYDGPSMDWATTLSGSTGETAAAQVPASLGPYEWRLRNNIAAGALTLEAVGEGEAVVVYRCDSRDPCVTLTTTER